MNDTSTPSIVQLPVAWLRRTADTLVVILFAIMMVGVLLQVGGRYVFNYSIAGTEEAARFAQIWMVFIGAGIAMRFGRHVAVDVLISFLPHSVSRILNILIAAGCLWFLAVVIIGAQPLIEVGKFETSPAMGIQMWTMYISLVIGSVYFGIEVILWMIESWKTPFKRSEAID